jgi:hypothetical protein
MAMIVLAFIAAVTLIGMLIPDLRFWGATLRWGLLVLLMVLFLMGIGAMISGRPSGALIDGRFKISLSRLQLAAWTVLALSALLTIALRRSLPNALPATLSDEQVTQCIDRLKGRNDERGEEIDMLWAGEVEVEVEMAVEVESSGEEKEADVEEAREIAIAEAKGRIREEARAKAAEACPPDPLGIRFPPELLLAMGISVTSFVSATLVKGNKASKSVSVELLNKQDKEVEDKKREATTAFKAAKDSLNTAINELAQKKAKLKELRDALAALAPATGASSGAAGDEERQKLQEQITQAETEISFLEESQAQLMAEKEAARKAMSAAVAEWEAHKEAKESREGLLHRNSDASQATWMDIFRGEEIANYLLVDLGKVQMFFITVAVVFSYAAALYGLLANGDLYHPLGVDLPSFSDTMNVLLGISHAGYLTTKAVDQTKKQS